MRTRKKNIEAKKKEGIVHNDFPHLNTTGLLQ
jgi:hypothetical protein